MPLPTRSLILAAALMLAPAPALLGAATAPTFLPAMDADRAEIEAVLADISKAVLAGDAAAYLAHIVPADGPEGDPVFRQEQVNWAEDLESDHGGAPAAFSLSIADTAERPAEFWPQRAEFELAMTWTMAAADGKRPPRERSVSFPAVFKNVDGAWLFAGENWIVIKGEGVVARTVEGFEDVAKRVVEVWPEVRAHVEEGFEIAAPGLPVQEVKIYGEMRHLQASIYLSYTDPLSGWNEPGEAIKIVGRHTATAAALKPLLAHELGHVATFSYGPSATDAPWWLVEGVAELASETFNPAMAGMTDNMVHAWARAGNLADWAEISDFRTVPPRLSGHVYRQGHHMLVYISQRHGRAGRNAWLRALAQGRTLDEATRETLGMSFTDLDAAWRAGLMVSEESAGEEPAAAVPPR